MSYNYLVLLPETDCYKDKHFLSLWQVIVISNFEMNPINHFVYQHCLFILSQRILFLLSLKVCHTHTSITIIIPVVNLFPDTLTFNCFREINKVISLKLLLYVETLSWNLCATALRNMFQQALYCVIFETSFTESRTTFFFCNSRNDCSGDKKRRVTPCNTTLWNLFPVPLHTSFS